jgi:hypothetical protein
MPAFKDHFSRQSAAYSRHRPGYPPELIDFVVASTPDRDLAIDCATGNGQAALQLALTSMLVLAIDGSQSQIAQGEAHERVRYTAATAESLPVVSGQARTGRGGAGGALVRFRALLHGVPARAAPRGCGCGLDLRVVPCRRRTDAIVADF